MGELFIICEGHTEANTLKAFLRPYWSKRFDDCQILRRDGNQDVITKLREDVEIALNGYPENAVLCLIDLYEEPFGVYKREMTREEGFRKVKERLEALVAPQFHTRFGAFPVVMEVETWLLVDLDYSSPEEVERPAKELKKLKPNYNKGIDGSRLFRSASAQRVYDDNCPHFKLMIDWLVAEPIEQTREVEEDPNQQQLRRVAIIAQQYVEKCDLEIERCVEIEAYERAERWMDVQEFWSNFIIEVQLKYSAFYS
ncbi:MAG: DUF4276 family protein [bacterium]|nr:DUF4276 family protein [bacterium]